MSRNDSEATDAMACKHCGKTGFGNAGAKARHEGACEGEGSESTEGDHPNAIRADDVETHEIASVLPNMDEASMKATLGFHDFYPKESDSLATATAKALLDAKGSGSDGYVTVFGRCAADDCDYGANGFDSDRCSAHEGDEPEPASEPETDDSRDYTPGTETVASWHGTEVPQEVGDFTQEAAEGAYLRYEADDGTVADITLTATTGRYAVDEPNPADPVRFDTAADAVRHLTGALEDASEPEEPEPEPSEGEGDDGPSDGKIAGALIAEGMDPDTAGKAAAFVRDAMDEGATASEAAKAANARFGE